MLLLDSNNPDAAAQVVFDRTLRETLQSGSPVPVDIYYEYLDGMRNEVSGFEKELAPLLRQKYSGKKFDCIFTFSDAYLRVLLKNRTELFPETPIIFLVVERNDIADLTPISNATGVWAKTNILPSLELALALHPGTKQVVLVSGVSDFDKQSARRADEDFRPFEGRVEFRHLVGLTSAELKKALAALPPRTIVFFLTNFLDNAGNTYDNPALLRQISPVSSVPVYGTTDMQLGFGIVGGDVLSFEALAVEAAKMGLRVLAGEKANSIAPHEVASVPMFDWRELQRWGISEENLPPGSIVRFKKPTFWQQYRERIIGALSLFFLQTLFIAFLLLERARRQRVTRSLRESEERFSKAFHSSPQPMSLATPDEGRYINVNERWLALSGYTRVEVIGHTSVELDIWESLAARAEFITQLKERGLVRNLETKFRTKDGQFRILLSSAELIELNEQPCILMASSDITERKQAELNTQFINQLDFELSRIAEADEIIRLATSRLGEYLGVTCCYVIEVNASADLAFVRESWVGWRIDGPSIVGEYRISDYVTQEFRSEFEAGQATIVEDVMNDPRTRDFASQYQSLSVGAFISIPALTEKQWEASLTVNHPQARDWRLDEMQLMRDITARLWPAVKQARAVEALRESEEALRKSYARIEDLAGRLIAAQEEERRHVARELHDDVSQHVAALAIGISRLKRQLSKTDALVFDHLKLREKTDLLTERIRQVSHDLHSSVLQHAGLPAALNSYCAEFSDREGIALTLDIRDGVDAVSADAALCLYRVAQESLRNVARHSGARSAIVGLERVNDVIELRVSDQGVGFDPGQARECHGLGLVSMEERVKLLHGSFILATRPGAGTELKAQIPLRSELEQNKSLAG